MTHLSENNFRLTINHIKIKETTNIFDLVTGFNDVCMFIFPSHNKNTEDVDYYDKLKFYISMLAKELASKATLISLGDPIDLVHVHAAIHSARFQLWISIKRENPKYSQTLTDLPEHHFGALVHTKYAGSLQHTTTRVKYTYCPTCNKSTKDYGGKKHTYNSYGTLLSDVWRDIACDLEADLTPVFERFADLFGLENYKELRILDFRDIWQSNKSRLLVEKRATTYTLQPLFMQAAENSEVEKGKLILGDCLGSLHELQDNSIDFAFIDPPYNLGKNYNGYADDLSIQEYFSWCDEWIKETARVLRPGRTLAILNIPLWAIRHFLYLETILKFQNWIVWDSLSFPVRKIMPAHYAIICFTKGDARPLPGLVREVGKVYVSGTTKYFLPLQPMDESYCLRANCQEKRNAVEITDRGKLTDLWWDIHRLKHNSRRVDHPCQLPPQLMYRLISLFTNPKEVVLDCFNGAGTTTLTAHQLDRQYIGIELSEKYHNIAFSRHEEIGQGIDPFRKAERELTEKNSHVARMPRITYKVPKKTLQLEVRRVAHKLNRLPTRKDMIEYGQYPIQYYDSYFASWGEVCAAARHDGMTEINTNESQEDDFGQPANQLELFSLNII